jgi:hypothetical protein
MKILTICSTALLATAMLFTSCSKEENNNNPTPTPIVTTGFFYGENGTTDYTKADSAYANNQYKTIIARKDNQTVIEFVVTNFQVGSQPLNTQYAFTYVKNNSHWVATAGTLNITQNTGTTISGTYEATAGSGVSGVNTVSGKFEGIPLN